MADTYFPQQYKNSEGGIEKHYIWLSEFKTAKHRSPITNQVLTYKDAYFTEAVDAPMVRTQTMTSKQITADRRHRATEHFKKEVLPTVNKKDKQYFAKKHNVKA
jgi:hypothetical protein